MAEYQDSSINIFYDIFRRADKNDDGAISWNEFKSYFSDGIFSNKELETLFNTIDTHNTNNIDISELSEYFSKHLGAFKEVLSSMETLNRSVSTVLNETSENYNTGNKEEQYITRFFLRESLSQIAAMQGSLEIACDHMDNSSERQTDEHFDISLDTTAAASIVDGVKSVQPGRYGRRNKRQISQKSNSNFDESELTSQVNRLKDLIDRFEKNLILDTGPEEVLNIEHEQLYIVINRKYEINPTSLKEFQSQLRNYVEYMNETDGLIHFSVRTYKSGLRHSLYEIWASKVALENHLSTTNFSDFQEASLNCSENNELNKMSIPSTWIQNNE